MMPLIKCVVTENDLGLSLEHPQEVGIVGIVGTVGTVGNIPKKLG